MEGYLTMVVRMKNKTVLLSIFCLFTLNQAIPMLALPWGLDSWFSTPEQQKKSLCVALMAAIGIGFFLWKSKKPNPNVAEPKKDQESKDDFDHDAVRDNFLRGQDGLSTNGQTEIPATGPGLGLSPMNSPLSDAERKQAGSTPADYVYPEQQNKRENVSVSGSGDAKRDADIKTAASQEQDLKRVKEPEISSDAQAEQSFQNVLTRLGRTAELQKRSPFWMIPTFGLPEFITPRENNSSMLTNVDTEVLKECLRELDAILSYYRKKIETLDDKAEKNRIHDAQINPKLTQKEIINSELKKRAEQDKGILVPSLMQMAEKNDVGGIVVGAKGFIDEIEGKFVKNTIQRADCSELLNRHKTYHEAINLCQTNVVNLMQRHSLTWEGYKKSLIASFNRSSTFTDRLQHEPKSLYTLVEGQLKIASLNEKSCSCINDLIEKFVLNEVAKDNNFKVTPNYYGIREAQTVLGNKFAREVYDAFCSDDQQLIVKLSINDNDLKRQQDNLAIIIQLLQQFEDIKRRLEKLQKS